MSRSRTTPGTTVEVTRGKGRLGGQEVGVVDTPGMYGLMPITDEERVARNILLHERPDVIVHVVDAKNLERMLPMTLQLIEAGLPVILNLNLMDEAERLGMKIDAAALERQLGVPVVATALALGRGTAQFKERIAAYIKGQDTQEQSKSQQFVVEYHPAIEKNLQEIESKLNGKYQLNRRAIAWLLINEDEEVTSLVRQLENRRTDELLRITETMRASFSQPISYIITQRCVERSPAAAGIPTIRRDKLGFSIEHFCCLRREFGRVFRFLFVDLLVIFL